MRWTTKLAMWAACVLAVVSAVLPTAIADGPRPRTGTIAGVVLQRVDGEPRPVPVADAVVRLVIRGEGPGAPPRVIREVRTNAQGQFRITEVRPGRYQLVASKEGAGRGVTPVMVRPGDTVRVRVGLRTP